jgi:hypothetical protein
MMHMLCIREVRIAQARVLFLDTASCYVLLGG